MLFKKKSRKFYFPITPLGALYLLGASGFVALGLHRGELGATLAGLLLLLYAFISFFSCLITLPFWRKAHLLLEQTQPGTFSLTVSDFPPRFLLFFCGARLSVRFNRSQTRSKRVAWRLDIPIVGETVRFVPDSPGRGVYQPQEFFIAIHDFAAFFSIRLYASTKNFVESVIYPARPEPHAANGLVSGGKARHTGKSTFERSENLYETRTYLPGDDPRKINWKVYAHSGTLSVREGELLPPPAAELFCIVSTQRPKGSGDTIQSEFNTLVNRTAAYLLEYLENNKTLILLLPDETGKTKHIRIDPGNPDRYSLLTEALAIPVLSSTGPDSLSEVPKLPPHASSMVFSLPGVRIPSFSQKPLYWFVGPYPLHERQIKAQSTLKRWLFLSNKTTYTRASFLPSEFEQYRSHLEKEGIHAHIL